VSVPGALQRGLPIRPEPYRRCGIWRRRRVWGTVRVMADTVARSGKRPAANGSKTAL